LNAHAILANFAAVVAGALLYETWAAGRLRNTRWAGLLLLVGLVLGSYSAQPGAGWFLMPATRWFAVFPAPTQVMWTLGAASILCGVMTSYSAKRILRTRVCQFLGRVSFSLYLVHWPLFATIGTSIYLANEMPARGPVLPLLLLFLSLAMAWALSMLVDEPLVSALHKLPEPPKQREYWACVACLLVPLFGFSVWRIGNSLPAVATLAIGCVALSVAIIPLLVSRLRCARLRIQNDLLRSAGISVSRNDSVAAKSRPTAEG